MVDFFFKFTVAKRFGLSGDALFCAFQNTLAFKREAPMILCLEVTQQLMPEIFRVVRTCYSLLLQLCAGYIETAKSSTVA